MSDKLAIITFATYKKWTVPFAILAMALFRLPLMFNKKNSFWKLMGSGKNGTFDIHPDWQLWSILTVTNLTQNQLDHPNFYRNYYSWFINKWWQLFGCNLKSYILQPIEGHGLWDKKEVFGQLPKNTDYEGQIAILTRATIHLNKLKSFWENVPLVAAKMSTATGLLQSYGIGEVPFIKQATFSIWESKLAMKNFAYKMAEHKTVVQKTHSHNWYKEEMFVRFKILVVF